MSFLGFGSYSDLRKAGLPIRYVTTDGFNPVDMLQILRREGFVCGTVSVDRDTSAYIGLKEAMLDGRVRLYHYQPWIDEISNLQEDTKRQKIEHLPSRKKDVADATAAVCHNIISRRLGQPLVRPSADAMRESISRPSIRRQDSAVS